jgi:transcriptional regulator with XRE-family HTH domain
MAAQLGVSRETIGRWTSGRGEPKRAGLLAWAAVTGVDLEWLETGKGPATTSPDPDPSLPRLDSNQQPSGYESMQVRAVPDRPATVTNLAHYRAGRAS